MNSKAVVKLVFRMVALITCVGVTGGCAYLGRHHQYVAVRTLPTGAEIYHDEWFVGQAPAFVKLDRRKRQSVVLKWGEGREQRREVHGAYRWRRSFLGNLIFVYYAPIGWIADILSGDAYEFPAEITIASDDPGELASPDSKKILDVAVAPPLSMHPNISDEVGRLLVMGLQERLGSKYRVLSYQDTVGIFESEDVDFDQEIKREHRNEIYGATGADRVYVSEVDFSGDRVEVRGVLQNYFMKMDPDEVNFSIPAAKLKSMGEDGVWAPHHKTFYWLPNAISLDFTNSSTAFDIDQVETEAEAEYTDDFWGKTARYISALSLRRIFPPSTRSGWRYRFSMIPTASLSYAREKFPTVAALSGLEFTRFHGDIGFGPSFNYGSKSLNIYLNILPTLAHDQIEATSTSGVEVEEKETRVNISSEFGFMFYISSHWHVRLFTRSVRVSESLWENSFARLTGTNFDVEGSSLLTSGVSIGYLIPNRLTRKVSGR